MTERHANPAEATLPDGISGDTMASFNPQRTISDTGARTVRFPDKPQRPTIAETEMDTVGDLSPGPGVVIPPPSGIAEGDEYKFLKKIGQGGMGEIWEAIQVSLGRTIAVKRLRSDVLDENERETARAEFLEMSFRQEALTAAGLEHPNIVPVHDLGVDEAGRPLLAMKLVRGKPWEAMMWDDLASLPYDEYLARHLPILSQVGQAVAFAHSHGIVHRDLKPSQVMVGEFGEVLLMDWGLAMTVDPNAMATRAASKIIKLLPSFETASNPAGTPAFMAPEQTEDTAHAIGTWTDVYLLGGTLYFILTGRPPHGGQDVKVVYMQARAGEVEPPEFRAPEKRIPAELSALAMKALAAQKDERIPSAREFVKGIEAYLSGANRRRESQQITEDVEYRLETAERDYRLYGDCNVRLGNARVLWPGNPRLDVVQERVLAEYARLALANRDLTLARVQIEQIPDSSTMRSQLMGELSAREEQVQMREHQRKIGLATAIVLLAALVVSSLLYSRYVRQEREIAMMERDRASRARLREMGARNDAENILAYLVNDFRDELYPIGRVDLIEKAARKALEYYDSLPAEDENLNSVAHKAEALATLSFVLGQKGNLAEALTTGQEALELARTASGRDQSNLAMAHRVGLGLMDLAKVENSLGRVDAAASHVKESLEIYARILSSPKGTEGRWAVHEGQAWGQLSQLYLSTGRIDEALAAASNSLASYEKAAEWDPDDYEVNRHRASGHESIGEVLYQQGKNEEALLEYQEAVRLRREPMAKHQSDRRLHMSLATSLDRVGKALRALGRTEEAMAAYNEFTTIAVGLTEYDPGNANWQRLLSSAYSQVGTCAIDLGENQQALEQYTKALGISEALAAKDASNFDWQDDVATDCLNLARTQVALGEFSGARDTIDKGLAVIKGLVDAQPANPIYRGRQWHSTSVRGSINQAGGDLAAAAKDFEAALAILRDLQGEDPSNLVHRQNILYHLYTLAGVYFDSGRLADAVRVAEEYASLTAEDFLERPDGDSVLSRYEDGLILIGALRIEQRRFNEALEPLRVCERLVLATKSGGDFTDYEHFTLAHARCRIGMALLGLNDPQGVVEITDLAIDTIRPRMKIDTPMKPMFELLVARIEYVAGRALRQIAPGPYSLIRWESSIVYLRNMDPALVQINDEAIWAMSLLGVRRPEEAAPHLEKIKKQGYTEWLLEEWKEAGAIK